MMTPISPKYELDSRLGRVGCIEAWDPWQSRKSIEIAKWWVSRVASLSYGNEEAKNPERLFQSIVEKGHLSCLEFVPCKYDERGLTSLPAKSLRTISPLLYDMKQLWGDDRVDSGKDYPATAFYVECPIFVARQWMRHRSFSYLEMSRRYVKEAKIPATFYGSLPYGEAPSDILYDLSVEVYNQLLDNGEPPELARRVLPVGMMTRFWCAGFDKDWEHFIKLREDGHAQQEIQVFATKIREILEAKNG